MDRSKRSPGRSERRSAFHRAYIAVWGRRTLTCTRPTEFITIPVRMTRKEQIKSMDLFDIFSGQESWHTRRLLGLAKTLNDEQLDRPLKNQVKVFPWDGPDQSLRQ